MIPGINTPRWRRYLSPRFLVGKVREKGFGWCACRFLGLVRSSLDRRTRAIRNNLWTGMANIQYRFRDKRQADVLYAFYDLAVSPATFDIVVFLVLAELERQEAGCSSLHVVIVPGPNEGFRQRDLQIYQRDGAGHYDVDTMRWRLRNILVPCCWLIPTCQQATVCTSQQEAMVFQASLAKHLFPKLYTIRFPRENYGIEHIIAKSREPVTLPTIQATPQARRFVNDWLRANAGGRKVIAITLRECSYERDRNSSKDWAAFASSLNPTIYYSVLVRDIETALKPMPAELDGLPVFPEAVWNVELRAALYELSYLNMSVNNGPSALFVFNRQARYLCFKMITPSCGATTELFFRSVGIEPGSQLPWAGPFQRLVWEDDRLEVIQKAFRDMCDQIEKSSARESGNVTAAFHHTPGS